MVSETEKNLNKAAGANRLNGYFDVNLIENYAERFGLDPNWVGKYVDFDTIIMFNVKWKLESEVRKKKEDLREMMSKSKVE